jgi:valyl-tRNA synthetase
LTAGDAAPAGAVAEVVRGLEVFLPLAGLVDLGAERARLSKELDKHRRELDALRRKLANDGFLAKAPPEVVAGERVRMGELEATAEKLEHTLTVLAG